jgi:hypothetical protein
MKELTNEEIEDEAYSMMMNFLTDNNPRGDFKHSTIGAECHMAWWIKGVKWYRDYLKSIDNE